jgi:hypothetical protein
MSDSPRLVLRVPKNFGLVSDDYLRTLGLRLLRGRALQDTEMAGARKVAMVNQTLVRKYFGNEDPLGRQVRLKMLESGVHPLPETRNLGTGYRSLVFRSQRNSSAAD